MNRHKKSGFTLIELLVVMAVIFILASLILYVLPWVLKNESRTRATNEIRAMEAALESYKSENGTYPDDAPIVAGSYTMGSTDQLDARVANDPTTTSAGPQFDYNGTSVNNSPNLVLYRALSGDRNLDRSTNATDMNYDLDGNPLSTPLSAPPPSYMSFPPTMLLPTGGTGSVTALVDPFGYPYGYSTAYQGDIAASGTTSTAPPANGYNATYDLWSTGGNVGTSSDSASQTQTKRAQWIYNWQNSGANVGQ